MQEVIIWNLIAFCIVLIQGKSVHRSNGEQASRSMKCDMLLYSLIDGV